MRPVKQTPEANARGLGSARTGSRHWWLQRISALALVPLTVWFTISFTGLICSDYQAYLQWIVSPLNAVLMITLVIILSYHMALGLRVIAEDYLHTDRVKILAIVTIQLGCLVLAITGIISVVRMMT